MARNRLTQEEAKQLMNEGYRKAISVQLMNDSHLQSDFSERYGDDYVSRWNSQSDLKKYYDDLAKLRDHTNLYRAYLNDYGTDEQKASLGDIDSALASYDAVLAEKDTVMSYYAPYASAEEFNTAYAENQAEIARNNKLAAMDIDAAKAELERLTANSPNYWDKPSAGYSQNQRDKIDALKRDIEDAEKIQSLQQLTSVTENDDFAEFSSGNANIYYHPYQYINSTSPEEKGRIRYEGRHYGANVDTLYDYFTDKEKGIFNYYVETNQIEKAEAYKAALEETLAAREAGDMFAFGEDHPFLASLASISMNLLSSVEQIGRIFDGKTNHMANVSSALRSGASSEMGGLGSFLYNTGMSAADSVLAALAPGQIGTVMLGLSAAGQTQNDIIQRGGTKEEAMLGGLAAGIFEGFFEHFSISELQKMKPNEIVRNFKVFLGNVGKEMGVNASEEMATELANILTDEIVMGELSNFNVAFEKYKAQGMSDSEAGMKIAGDLFGQVLEAGASGALMGFGFASIGGGIGAVQRTVDGKRIVQADSEGRTKKLLIGKAETLFGDKAEYAEQRRLLDEVKQHLGKDTPAQQHRLGVLLQEVQKATAKEMMNKAQENVSRTIKQAQESASAAIVGGKNADVVYDHLPEIVEYTGMKGNQIMVKGKDGETVSLSSLSLEDRELGEVYAYATTLGSVEAANSFLTYYEADMVDAGTTPTEFWTSWMGAQTLGQTLGASDAVLNEARATYGGTLSVDAVTAAVIAGVNLRQRAQKQKTEAAEAYKKAWKDKISVDERGGEIKQNSISESANSTEFNQAERTQAKNNFTESYHKRIDAWDGQTEGFSFVLGNTPFYLSNMEINEKKIGKKQVRIDATKIKKIMKDHSEMTKEVIKQLPQLLNDPILVLDSKTVSGRLVLLGEVYANHKPVMMALEINPSTRSGNSTYVNVIKVASAYTRSNTQNLINGSNIRYVCKNKSRVEDWLKVNRLQLPLPNFQSDSAGDITDRMNGGDTSNNSIAQTFEKSRPLGKFDDSKIQDELKNKATKEQQQFVEFARIFSDVFGINVTFFASEQGKRGENGRYDPKTNTIYLDLYAGIANKANYKAITACLINTLSHESVHNMAVNAPTEYFALRDYVMEVLHRQGYNTHQRIQEIFDGYAEKKQTISREQAIEEIVAAACEDMLGSSETVREFMEGFYEKNKKAAEKFSDVVKKILENLKKFFAKFLGKKSMSNEATTIAKNGADIIAEIQKRFDTGMLALREGNMARNAANMQENVKSAENNDTAMRQERNRLSDSDLSEYLKAGGRANKSKIEAIKQGKKIILTNQEDIISFIDRSIKKEKGLPTVAYGNVTERLAFDVEQYSNGKIQINGNYLELVPDDISHAYVGHLQAKQEGDIDLTKSDFEKIPEYIDNYDDLVYAIQYQNGNTRICLSKKTEQGRILLIETVSKSRGSLQFKNMIGVSEKKYLSDYETKYKKRNRSNSRGSKSSNISLHDESVSINSISEFDENVNTFSEISDESLKQTRIETPEPSELLADLFSDKEAFESYAEHKKSLVKYQNLLKQVQTTEKKVEEIDQNIQRLRSEKRQSGKGSRMDDLYRQRKAAEDTIAEYKKRIFAMEAKELRAIVDAETRKAVERMQKETSEKYRAKSKERTENRSRREYIEKIEKRAKALGKAIEENSKDSHIPEIFQRTVADLISALDFSSRQSLAGGEATKKEALLVDAMQRMSEALNNRLRDENGKETASESLQAYLLACDMKDDLAKEFGDIYYNINQIARQYGSGDAIVLEKMTAVDLKALNSALFNISKMISNANKMIANHRYASIEALAETSIADLKGFERYHSKIEGAEKLLRWSHATPFTAFRRMGKGSYSLFEEFMDGMDDFAFKAESILDFTDEAYTKKESREWSEQIHCFETNGGMLYMTTADIMSLYCLNKRQKSNDFTGGDHIGGGGIQLGKRKGTIEGEKGTKEYANDPSGVAVSQALLSEILSKLTDRQREVADALQRFMSETCAEWGNEVSMKRFGTRQFLEQFYFPIQSSKETLYQDGTERTKDQALFALLNASFTQKLNEQANNRIEIRNIFDVFADHAVMMAKYHAFAFALLDMRKWLNYKVKTNIELGEEGKGFETAEIRALLKNAYGEAAEKYIKTFLEDINGAHTETDRDMTLLKKMVSNYKIAAVGVNLNVALIQPTAYLRASAEIDPRYMVKELKDTPQIGQAIKRAMQYSGMMVWKSLGYRDVNIAASLQDKIKHTESTMHKIQEKTMILAEKADQITWGALWLACEEETKAKRNDLTDQTDEFYRAVALRFREVIYATQVVDSPLTKSQFMRSKSGWNSFFGSFMSEPVQSYNTFLRVADEITDRKRRGLKITTNQFRKLGRVTAAFFMCELATALIRSFLDAFHDYDEDEEYWELYWENFTETFVSGLVIPKIPVIKDIFEAAKQSFLGEYASSRMDMALSERAGRFARYLYNLMFTDKDVSWSKIVKSFLDFLSTATGLPFSNLYREVESTYTAFVK